MELETRDDGTSPGLGHLESFKNRASFLFKDSLKIARLALVDISAAELMTEDATNADDWGPTTKAMADISNAIFNSEDYLRIVQVLHKRFALSTKKYWRQIHKSLILLEYLLCHGPEHLVMEFRQDKDRFEEFARFVYVDWTGVERGSAIQKRAKHVLHLLMDEAFYKEERTRAQKVSRGISGFGSQSFYHRGARPEPLNNISYYRSEPSNLLNFGFADQDGTTLLFDEDDQSKSPPDTKKTLTCLEGDISLRTSQSTSELASWHANFSSLVAADTLSASGRSTTSIESEESPTSVLSLHKGSHILNMDSFTFERAPTKVENMPLQMCLSPKFPHSPSSESSPRLHKLPPPPPMAEYKCITPRPPQSKSRVRQKQPGSMKVPYVLPDLITI